jgi:hypothetical protein
MRIYQLTYKLMIFEWKTQKAFFNDYNLLIDLLMKD